MSNNDFKNRSIGKSFRDALRGLWFCIKSERNMRIHTVMAAYVLFFAGFLGLSRGEYAILIAVIGIMVTSEAFNTAIEKLCDFDCKDYDRIIGKVKDISAGAVLISAVFAACIGVVLLYKPAALLALCLLIIGSPLSIFLLALSLVFALWYIAQGPLGMRRGLRKVFKPHRRT